MPTSLLDNSNNYIPQKGTDGAGHTLDYSLRQGESETFDRTFGGAMCLASVICTSDTLINTGPCIVYGYTVHVATATAAITIEDGVTAGSGATKVTIPASKAVGEYALPVGIYCATGAYLNFTGTGSVAVLYLPAA